MGQQRRSRKRVSRARGARQLSSKEYGYSSGGTSLLLCGDASVFRDDMYADDEMGGTGSAQQPRRRLPILMAICFALVVGFNVVAVCARGSMRRDATSPSSVAKDRIADAAIAELYAEIAEQMNVPVDAVRPSTEGGGGFGFEVDNRVKDLSKKLANLGLGSASHRMLNEEEEITPTPIASLEKGYASGTSSVFWLKGDPQEDYPYLCKCDPSTLEMFRAGVPIEMEDSSKWWNPFSDSPSEHASGVPCSGSVSAVISSGVPFCDAINASAGRAVSRPLLLSIALAVALSIR